MPSTALVRQAARTYEKSGGGELHLSTLQKLKDEKLSQEIRKLDKEAKGTVTPYLLHVLTVVDKVEKKEMNSADAKQEIEKLARDFRKANYPSRNVASSILSYIPVSTSANRFTPQFEEEDTAFANCALEEVKNLERLQVLEKSIVDGLTQSAKKELETVEPPKKLEAPAPVVKAEAKMDFSLEKLYKEEFAELYAKDYRLKEMEKQIVQVVKGHTATQVNNVLTLINCLGITYNYESHLFPDFSAAVAPGSREPVTTLLAIDDEVERLVASRKFALLHCGKEVAGALGYQTSSNAALSLFTPATHTYTPSGKSQLPVKKMSEREEKINQFFDELRFRIIDLKTNHFKALVDCAPKMLSAEDRKAMKDQAPYYRLQSEEKPAVRKAIAAATN